MKLFYRDIYFPACYTFLRLQQLAYQDTNQAQCINEIRVLNWKIKFLAVCVVRRRNCLFDSSLFFMCRCVIHWHMNPRALGGIKLYSITSR